MNPSDHCWRYRCTNKRALGDGNFGLFTALWKRWDRIVYTYHTRQEKDIA
jgi:hypothetical protein